MLTSYLFYVSVVVFPISFAWMSLCLIAAYQYEGSIRQKLDLLKGIRRTWPVSKTALVALLSGCYLLTYIFG